jgi:hypothetical protein
MALVSDGFKLNVNLVDKGANITSRQYELLAADAATALTQSTAIIAALNAVTDAVVVGYGFGENFVEDNLVYPLTAEIENQAFFSAKIVGAPNKSATLSVPAPIEAIFTSAFGPGNNIVDMSNALVLTYLQLFDNTGPATISDGEQLVVSSASGKRRHVKSNKG